MIVLLCALYILLLYPFLLSVRLSTRCFKIKIYEFWKTRETRDKIYNCYLNNVNRYEKRIKKQKHIANHPLKPVIVCLLTLMSSDRINLSKFLVYTRITEKGLTVIIYFLQFYFYISLL